MKQLELAKQIPCFAAGGGEPAAVWRVLLCGRALAQAPPHGTGQLARIL